MYERYWGLSRRPFDDVPDAECFVRTDTHHAAVLKLRYLVEHRQGLGVLAGEPGAGKSTVISVLDRDLPPTYRPVVHVVYPRMTPVEMLSCLAVELGADAISETKRAAGVDEIIREIQTRLGFHAAERRAPVLIVDEAHLIEDPAVLQSLRLLLNFRRPPQLDFSLILSGDLALLPQIQRIAALDDRVAVKCVLQPLTFGDAEEYVAVRLQRAGATRPIFTDDALRAAFELSGGVPRRLNRLCDLALLVGYADSLERLTEREIESIAEELVSVVPD